jgi:hypothetical protein
MRMPFGKYRDRLLSEIPDGYLAWLLRECDLSPWLRDEVQSEIQQRHGRHEQVNQEAEAQERAVVGGVLQGWYRQLCLRYHPDRGGSDQEMRVVNDAYERLRNMVGART